MSRDVNALTSGENDEGAVLHMARGAVGPFACRMATSLSGRLACCRLLARVRAALPGLLSKMAVQCCQQGGCRCQQVRGGCNLCKVWATIQPPTRTYARNMERNFGKSDPCVSGAAACPVGGQGRFHLPVGDEAP